MQASSSSRQQRRWAIVCSSPQLQFKDWVSSMYPHLLVVLLTRPTTVRRRFRERQQSHAWSDPAGRDSAASNPILLEAGISAILLFHICILVILGDESSGVTVCMKLFRDFSRLAAGICVAYAMAIVLTSPYVLGYQFPYGSQPQFENKCQLINMRSLHLGRGWTIHLLIQ